MSSREPSRGRPRGCREGPPQYLAHKRTNKQTKALNHRNARAQGRARKHARTHTRRRTHACTLIFTEKCARKLKHLGNAWARCCTRICVSVMRWRGLKCSNAFWNRNGGVLHVVMPFGNAMAGYCKRLCILVMQWRGVACGMHFGNAMAGCEM